jgi:hypothetical protein
MATPDPEEAATLLNAASELDLRADELDRDGDGRADG